MMRAFPVLLLITVAFAGCADQQPQPALDVPVVDTLSEKLYDILPVQELYIDMSDAKGMHHAIYRPDTDAPVPVFINFSPYWGDTAELGGDAFSQYMINEYVPRGYAVVLAALRGTGHSEGCFQIGGDRELLDMHETIEYFATQDWSNGNIATGGKSYDSSPTNGLIAKFPHPALKGVFHVSGITDMYLYNYKGGVPYATGPIFNTYYYLQGTDEYGASLVGAGGAGDEDAESLARVIDDAACTELPAMQAAGVGSGVHGMKDAYWIERDWNRYIGDSDWNGSIFFVHGLQDWNVKPDHILPWIENLPEQIRVKGWLHQGAHVYPERVDWNETMLRWLDQELKGKETGIWDEPRWDVRADNDDWYRYDAWPAGSDILGFNQFDFSSLDGDVIELRSDLYGQEVHLTGDITFRPTVTGANPDGVVTVTVFDEAPDGSRTWVTEGMLRLIYRDGLDSPSPWVGAGAQETVELRTYPFDHVFPAGHALVAVFQEDSRNGLVTPAQLAGLSMTGFKETDVFLVTPGHGPLVDQPADMECFAC